MPEQYESCYRANRARGNLEAALADLERVESSRVQHQASAETLRAAIDARLSNLRNAHWDAERARSDAQLDPLTHALNRRGLPQQLDNALASARAAGVPYAIAMIDIDFFKRVNDKLGHQVGDRVLVRISQAVQASSRSTDLFGRYGGDEFVFGAFGACAGALTQRCEQLIHMVAQLDFSSPGIAHPVTISAGVSDTTEAQEMGELLRQADARLYEAKRLGKNRVQGRAPI